MKKAVAFVAVIAFVVGILVASTQQEAGNVPPYPFGTTDTTS